MAHGTPAPSLVLLRHQADAKAPRRSRASDGIMGDAAHHARTSDHNLGNAIDLTHDPLGGLDAGATAEEARRQMKSYPSGRISLIIWNRQKASRSTGWQWRRYTGPNPHTSHVHLSIRPSARGELRPWSILRG